MQTSATRHSSIISWWLVIGLILIFFQILIGVVTRLTDSGLSITEWSVIQGTFPPLSTDEWLKAFDLYKHHASKQYLSIHADMTLKEFKFIFFWEYFHRLWARIMGFIFFFPFIFFLIKGWLAKKTILQLSLVFLLAAMAAVFGWIMVASGLNTETYAWVNAYKLSIHLSIAFGVFITLLWTYLSYNYERQPSLSKSHFPFLTFLLFVTIIQIIFGAWMSGMKAGLFYNDWPTIGHQWFPDVLTNTHNWNWYNVTHYTENSFMITLVHLLHRTTAYLLLVLVLVFHFVWRKKYYATLPKSYLLLIIISVEVLIVIW